MTRFDLTDRLISRFSQSQFKDIALWGMVNLGTSGIFLKGSLIECRKTITCRNLLLKNLKSHLPYWYPRQLSCIFLSVFLMAQNSAFGDTSGWSIGGYGGPYYDSMPAEFVNGRANYLSQYIVAFTASKTVWHPESLPLALEIDGMIGYQFGLASLGEIAIAPVLRWSSFPWKEILQTDIRFGPLGLSYTTSVSPLELGTNGKGSNILNFLVIELDFSLPRKKSEEIFLRLHHRCSIYDLLNDYGANGEDFAALGYRHHF